MIGSDTYPRRLRYACDRTWEEMAPTQGGRFCETCQKPVTDFTGLRKEELRAWFRSGAAGCGRYTVQQLDPSLVPLGEVGRGARRGFIAAIAALAIGGAQAQSEEPAQATEQADSLARENELRFNTRIAAEARNPKLERSTCPPLETLPPPKTKKVTYLSWRFPFVHRVSVRETYRMGFF